MSTHRPVRVVILISLANAWCTVKTLRIELPVLASDDADTFLDLATGVRGVVAAMVSGNAIEVVVSGSESALLVREEVVAALAAGVGVAS